MVWTQLPFSDILVSYLNGKNQGQDLRDHLIKFYSSIDGAPANGA